MLSISSVPINSKRVEKMKTPITLSGFLGAGKQLSYRVPLKLIKSKSLNNDDGIDTLELQNGCVCCSLVDDMMQSVAKLTALATMGSAIPEHYTNCDHNQCLSRFGWSYSTS
jgi:hypothetical protein